jgi:hypothetical protein
MMRIAIDYDDTYTLSPDLWDQIINLLITADHKVYCVTKRHEHLADDIKKIMRVPIIFAKKSKMEAVNREGIKIDVWIDDKPQSIFPYTLINKGFQRRY